ncbi:9433_t:CDS:10, partial [Gigaspora margarita]
CAVSAVSALSAVSAVSALSAVSAVSAVNAGSAMNAESAVNALFWEYVKKEMTEEKGLDPNIADRIKLKAIEMNEEILQKRNADLMKESESSSETEEYATNKKSHGHYEASCYYCVPKKSWARGKPAILEAHLANECSNSLPNQIAITTHFLSDRLLPKAAVNRLDQKIAKAWIIAGILFEVIKNPFIKDMFKEFLPAYDPLSRTTLSGRLLDEEIAQINCAIDKDIDRADHLTLANEISNIIEKLGSDKFAAVVTDAASNLKTRWGSLYFTTDSMLRARPVFDWLLSEHLETITDQEIANLLANEDFFITCRLVRSIWQPIKEVIYVLETNTAILADCFAYLIKLAVAIKYLPEINTFKASAVHVFNRQYEEFLHPLYILAYYIHPQYRGKCLKDNGFHQVALTSIEIWQNLGHTELESNELIAQMRQFEARLPPFNLSYVSDACNLSSVGNIMCYKENQIDNNDEPLSDISNYSTTLLINEIIDLEIEKNSEPLMEEISRAVLSEDLDYNPCDVLNRFLEHKKQSK